MREPQSQYPLERFRTLRSAALALAAVLIAAGVPSEVAAQITFNSTPGDIAVYCRNIPTMPALTATTNCTGTPTYSSDEQTTDGTCRGSYTITRTWNASDDCSFTTQHVQTITVFDDQPPVITGVPTSQTVRPEDIPPDPNPGVVDFCDDSPTLETFPVDSVEGACDGYTKIWRYIARDDCGNESELQYVLTVSGIAAPTFSSVPAGRRLSCGESLPPPPGVTATDANGDPVPVELRLDSLYNRGGDTCLIVERVWTATDDCFLTSTTRQRYTLHDDTRPTLTGVPGDTVIYCEALPPLPVVTGADDCDTAPQVTYEEISGQTNDGTCTDVSYVTVRRWTVSDECGNATIGEQRITMKCECCDNGIDDDDDGLVDDYDPQCNCFAGVVDECDDTKRYYLPPVWRPNRADFNNPSQLVISTLAPVANIQIQTADGTTFNQVYTVTQGSPLVLDLTPDQLMTAGHNQVERDKGWIITSNELIQPIYRIDGKFNKVLVTIKGPQALGRVFRAGSQTSTCGLNAMGSGEGHFISVMATEDNTQVTIDFDFPALNGLTGPVTRTLNRNETYLIRDDVSNTTVSGSLITATKPVAVTTGSQHTKACTYPDGPGVAGGKDGGIDQLVPNCLTGDEYVLVRGEGGQVQHYAILVANKNNTVIEVDGDANNTITLAAGEYFQYWLEGGDYEPRHFKGNKPFYVYHVSGISNNNEVGMAIAAPVGECKGDTIIEFPLFASPTSTAPVRSSVYTILPESGLASLTINGQPYSSCATARAVPARPDLRAVVFETACLQANNNISSDEFFTAGMLVGISGQTGTHGYLTAFKDRMSVFDPITDQPTTGFLADTLCGEEQDVREIKVQSCATLHSIAAVRNGAGTIELLGGTRYRYTAPEQFQGLDELFITIKNDQGLFQTVCVRYYICGEPPVVTFPFIDTTVVCDDIPPITDPIASDECGMDVYLDTEEFIDPGTCDFSYLIRRNWVIYDDCGDSTSAVQQIFVVDTTAPLDINLRDTTVDVFCSGIPPAPTPNFLDNCDNSITQEYLQDTLDYVCEFDYTLRRTWTAYDQCGNRDSVVHLYVVRDTAGPILEIDPPALTLACGDPAPQPTVTLSLGCDPNAVIVADSTVRAPDCDTVSYVIRRWTATDVCGAVSTATQTVAVIDGAAPVASDVPADTTLRCGVPLPTTAPTFTDDCADPPAVTVVDSLGEPTCPEVEVVYRTWTAVDDCGKVTTARRRIERVDLEVPVIVPIPDDTLTSSCSSSEIFQEPIITDDCDFAVTRQDSFWSKTCDAERYVRRLFTVVDSCGNTAEYEQVYYFTDKVAPVWLQQPNDTVLACGEPIPEVIDVNVVDACSGLNAVEVEIRDSVATCPAERYIFRTYVVSDWCNNLDTLVHTILIEGCEPDIPVLTADVAACTGDTITLTAELGGTAYATPKYRWEYSPDTISWTTLAHPVDSFRLTIVDADAASSGWYRVTVADSEAELGNPDCSSTSEPVDLRLSDPASTTTPISLCLGDTLFYLGDTLTASVTRVDTLTTVAGCDSFARLELDVFPFVELAIDTTLCFGESFEYFGVIYDSTGFFRDTVITAAGCDSTIALDLTVKPDLRDTVFTELCEGGVVTFEGVDHTASGTYPYPLQSLDGCDSTRTLVLVAYDTARTLIDTTVCPGTGVAAFGETFFASGRYVRTLSSAAGCDSTVQLDLTVADTSFLLEPATLCRGETYFFEDLRITEPGRYRREFTSSLGCDSVRVVDVAISEPVDTEIQAQLCAGEVYTNGGSSFTEPGRWSIPFFSVDGCDSTVYVTLSFRPNFDQAIADTICAGDSYQLADTVLTTPGYFERADTTKFGCDSLIRLTLVVAQPTTEDIDRRLCFGESLEVAGETYTTTTTETIVIPNAVGCDSIINLKLRVADDANVDTTTVICYDEVFETGGRVYDSTGVYRYETTTASNCDSSYTVYLTQIPDRRDTLEESICQGDTLELPDLTRWTKPGEYEIVYSTASGCDSTLVLMLEVRDTTTGAATVEVCAGEGLLRDGQTFDAPDTYTYKILNEQQCDSTVVLTVIWVEPTLALTDTLVCADEVVDWRGRTLTAPGYYADTLASRLDCDSVIAIRLEHYSPATTRDTVEVCAGDSVSVAGVIRTEAGEYPETFPGFLGCDSTHVTQLVYKGLVSTADTVEICPDETYDFDGDVLVQPGDYVKTYTAVDGCDSTSALTLVVLDTVKIEADDLEICRGESQVLEARTNGPIVRWTPARGLSCDVCPLPIASPDSTTVYVATTTACDGSEVSAQVTVTVNDAVAVEIVATERLRLGESATLLAVSDNPSANLTWEASGEMLCDDCAELEVRPTETTLYELSASTDAGCEATAQLRITIEDECAFGEVLIPNFLTPNGDGANDVLEIGYEGIGDVTLLRIFNRWGEVVYETRDIDVPWDGTHRGVPLNPGVFVYYLEGFCLNDEPFTQEGNVTLVR